MQHRMHPFKLINMHVGKKKKMTFDPYNFKKAAYINVGQCRACVQNWLLIGEVKSYTIEPGIAAFGFFSF